MSEIEITQKLLHALFMDKEVNKKLYDFLRIYKGDYAYIDFIRYAELPLKRTAEGIRWYEDGTNFEKLNNLLKQMRADIQAGLEIAATNGQTAAILNIIKNNLTISTACTNFAKQLRKTGGLNTKRLWLNFIYSHGLIDGLIVEYPLVLADENLDHDLLDKIIRQLADED